MSKNTKQQDVSQLRATADALVATWRELEAVAQAKREAYANFKPTDPKAWSRSTVNDSTEDRLREATMELEKLQAEEPAERAGHAAAVALDAAEVAEDDEVALARDPRLLHAAVVSFDAEERELQEKIGDVQRRRAARELEATRADAQHAARRQVAGLPVSTPIPRPHTTVLSSDVERMDARGIYLRLLIERAEKGAPSPSRRTQIEGVHSRRRRIAADLETARREREEEKKSAETLRANKHWAEQQQQRKVHEAEKARNDERAAAEKERADLANAYLERTGNV